MFLIAGPCAIESREIVMHTAETLKQICDRLGIPLYFKSSYDKANRTSISERGVGMEKGLEILQEVKSTFSLPILTDVHESWQCAPVAEVADVLQIPAFLSHQTDLLVAAAKTGKVVNVKKGQFMAPWDMRGAIAKIAANHPLSNAACQKTDQHIWLTERGSSFGYGNIIVDMTCKNLSISYWKKLLVQVIKIRFMYISIMLWVMMRILFCDIFLRILNMLNGVSK